VWRKCHYRNCPKDGGRRFLQNVHNHEKLRSCIKMSLIALSGLRFLWWRVRVTGVYPPQCQIHRVILLMKEPNTCHLLSCFHLIGQLHGTTLYRPIPIYRGLFLEFSKTAAWIYLLRVLCGDVRYLGLINNVVTWSHKKRSFIHRHED
jgi:hypothetical protein